MTTRLLRFVLGFFALIAAAHAAAPSLEDAFVRPPDDARPWVFWFWSDGNVTRKGITADLEAMKRVGIGGVVFMEVDQNVPKGPARFMTPEWRDLFSFAVSEATRLGLKFDLNNDAGWSGSGGPWIDAEHSMQKVVWSEQRVAGPGHVDMALAQPESVGGFYRDITVLAFPTPVSESHTMQAAGVTATTSMAGTDAATLVDGNLATGITLSGSKEADAYVELQFARPFEARSLTILTGGGSHLLGHLQISADGTSFHELAQVQSGPAGRTFDLVRSRFFRVVFDHSAAAKLRVNEITLSAVHTIDRFVAKSGLALIASPDDVAAEQAGVSVPRTQVLDLSANLHEGRLSWDAPPGQWTILRFGHTSTGVTNHPAPAEGTGFEVDKLSRDALDRHYDGFAGKLIGSMSASAAAALDAVHVDSWEVGYQNWTADFRKEFRQRRGYDPVAWLPTFTGRVVDTEALSERFLWDVRRTISEMLDDNYAARIAERAHAQHRQFTLEGYRYGPFDCLSYTGRADIPVGEFWVSRDPANLHPSVKTMASAGHIYGKPVIGAEAFTATDALGSQRNHPYSLKAIGDAAFCAGINQFIIHRYSMQPWVDDRKPGMTMGPWGVEYERTATWWEQTPAWHEYLARCQYLLRQGHFVADLCYLQSEEGFNNPAMPADIKPAVPAGYDFDLCSDEVVRTRMAVDNGRLRLADGMSYRVLVLPAQRLMTPALLRQIRTLVRAGAVVYGPPPWHSPSLAGYPQCDTEIKALVDELWENCECDGHTKLERTLGKGKVIWGCSLEELLHALDLERDFAWRPEATDDLGSRDSTPAPIHYIHRELPDRDVYFVANLSDKPTRIVASFRVGSGQPELWEAETGAMQPAVVFEQQAGRTRLPLALGARGSVFVVIRKTAAAAHATAITRDGRAWTEAGDVPATAEKPVAPALPTVRDSFTLLAWVRPDADTALPMEDLGGTSAYSVARNDVLFPPPAHELMGRLDVAGAGFSVGRNGITVVEHGDHHFPATLVYRAPITGWTHVAVVFDRGVPSLYVNGDRVRTGLKTAMTVYGGVGVKHGRDVPPFRGEHSPLQQFDRALTAAEIKQAMRDTPRSPERTVPREAEENARAQPLPALLLDRWPAVWASQRGHYEIDGAGAGPFAVDSVPAPIAVTGPWTLHFPAGWGAPGQVPWPKLVSWTQHAEAGVRYFSGTARYETTVTVAHTSAGQRLWLDLGDVREIAEVVLNGHALGTLWKPPFRVEITTAVHPGENRLAVMVTNLWVNRLIGDEQQPLDREWTKVPRRGGFALKAYPDWFLRGERSPVGRLTFTTWKHYEKDAPLLPSGLLGPVTIESAVRVTPEQGSHGR
jgi:hypothetical protein